MVHHASEATQDLLSRLEHVKKNGNGWIARCPAHDDGTPSFSIAQGDDGRVLLHCHAGCTVPQICSALGISEADLFVKDDDRPGRRHGIRTAPVRSAPTRTEPAEAIRSDPPRFATAREAVESLACVGTRTASYAYHDASGEPVGVVVRFQTAKGKKSFRPVAKNGTGWVQKAMPEPRPLYRLPKIADAERIVIFEGEKCAGLAADCGLDATTWPGGASAAARVLQSEFFDSGLVPRFILAAPPETPARAWTDDEDDPDREAELFEVFDYLYGLELGVTVTAGQAEAEQNEIAPRLVRMEPAARKAFVAYYERLEKRRAKEPSERFRTAMSKHKSLPPRLALGFHFVKVATGEHTDAVMLGAETMKAAIELVEDWVTPETARVYRLLAGQDVDGGESADLLRWIASRDAVTVRDVYSKGPQKYRNDPGRTRTTLDGLVDDGELTRAPKPGGRTFVYRVSQGVMH